MQKKWGPVVVALMILISGCDTVMVPLSGTNDSPLRLSIAVGDTVRVLTKYGDRPTFEVTDITENALIEGAQQLSKWTNRRSELAGLHCAQHVAGSGIATSSGRNHSETIYFGATNSA